MREYYNLQVEEKKQKIIDKAKKNILESQVAY